MNSLHDYLDAMHRLAGRARQAVWRERSRVEDRRLTAEQRRGVLGPAHLHWRENSSIDNRRRWSGYDWRGPRSPMSRGLFATLAAERGLQVECQLDSWGPAGRYDLSGYGDAITVCKH
jgi:hypothetical protein